MLVVTGGPVRLLARLGVRAAVAPEDVTVARIRAAHPDLVVVGPGVTAREAKRNETFIRELDVPVFVMPGARLPDVERGAVALGLLTNNAEAGRSLAISLRRQREDIAKTLSTVPPLTVYVDAGFGTSIQRTTLLARLSPSPAGGSSARPTGSRRSTPRPSTGSTPTPTSRPRRAASRWRGCARGPHCARCARSRPVASSSSIPPSRAPT